MSIYLKDECTIIFERFMHLKYVYILGQRYRSTVNEYGTESTNQERYITLKRDKSDAEEIVVESDLSIMWKIINGVLHHHSFHEGWLQAEKNEI